MRPIRSRVPLLSILSVACALVAAPCRAAGDPADPFESMNRRFFAVQETLDRHFFRPLARGFGRTPSSVRAGLRNFTRNLGEPVVFVNDVLQARGGQAARTLARLAVNSTFGVAGILDVAKKNHLPHHDNGFGTTLGRWGAVPGPYLFLPLIGPSTLRDTVGSGADIGLNPLTYARYPDKTAISIAITLIEGLEKEVDAERDLETIRQTSIDPYATIRSDYLQNRQVEITGKPLTIETLPELEEPGMTPPESTPPESTSPTGGPPAQQPQPTAPTPPPPGEAGALPQPDAAKTPQPPDAAAGSPTPKPRTP